MQKLRSVHLYLGCIFAPMLLFFAVSGVWQIFGLHHGSETLRALSSIHNQQRLKQGGVFLGSPMMSVFVLAMSFSFIVTTVLGIMMAFKFGRSRRAAFWCLGFGIIFPLAFALSRLF